MATSKLTEQFLRYIVAGGLAFVCDISALWVMTEHLGIHYLISASLAFLLGLAVNYLICVGFIFEYRASVNSLHEFALFTAVGLLGLALNALILFGLTEGLALHYLTSKLFSAAVVLLFNFSARRHLLFSDNRISRRLFGGEAAANCPRNSISR